VTAPAAPTAAPVAAARIAGAATLIAALTVLARLAGFGRTAIFANTVGTTDDLGSIYQAANTLPNIVFELVAGGALASLVVPLVSGAAAAGDRARVSALASALLTWVLSLLVPVAVLVAVFARPVVDLLPGAPLTAEQADLAARMLRVFAPQLPLYGIGIVLTGVLQAHHRFAWPVLAPLLSSVAVMGAYLAYAAVDGAGTGTAGLSRAGELLLSVGTTAGVVVLSLCLLIPLRRLRLRLRPAYRFPGGEGRQALRLGWAGAVTVGAQQVALLAVLVLTFGAADNLYAVYLVAQSVYLLPWAVLAVPVATAVYPRLAAAYEAGDAGRFAADLSRTTRSVILLSCLGAAGLIAVAGPVGVFMNDTRNTAVLVALAPGLLGYGLFALLSRALYARRAPGAAALAVAVGWAVATAGAFALSAGLPVGRRLPALAAANAAGMLVLGALLLLAVRRRVGAAALGGAGRAAAAGLLAGAAGASAGWAVVTALDAPLIGTPTHLAALVQGILGGAVALAVFLAVAWLPARRDIAPTLTALRRRVQRRRAAPAEPDGRDAAPGRPGVRPRPDAKHTQQKHTRQGTQGQGER
jgi:putative peptidoglycan lipid II flippase